MGAIPVFAQTPLADFGVAVDMAARGIEAIGVVVIVLGAAVSSVRFVASTVRGRDRLKSYQRYRGRVGRSILLGLEFLIAADIIHTVAVEPTFYGLGVLAGIVLIRTFLSFTLEVEIDGRWPWEHAGADRPVRDAETKAAAD